jgi:hypothetical protein
MKLVIIGDVHGKKVALPSIAGACKIGEVNITPELLGSLRSM